MAKQGLRVMDSDLHVIEPHDLWTNYLDPKFRDRIQTGPAGDGQMHARVDGKVLPPYADRPERRRAVVREAHLDPRLLVDERARRKAPLGSKARLAQEREDVPGRERGERSSEHQHGRKEERDGDGDRRGGRRSEHRPEEPAIGPEAHRSGAPRARLIAAP